MISTSMYTFYSQSQHFKNVTSQSPFKKKMLIYKTLTIFVIKYQILYFTSILVHYLFHIIKYQILYFTSILVHYQFHKGNNNNYNNTLKIKLHLSQLLDINRISIILGAINSSPSKYISCRLSWVESIPEHIFCSICTWK